MKFCCVVVLLLVLMVLTAERIHHDNEFPKGHLQYHIKTHKINQCDKKQTTCKKRIEKKCWGYEEDCLSENIFDYPVCDKQNDGWKSLEQQTQTFWYEGGFGYIKNKIDTMVTLCKPNNKDDSLFQCNVNWEYCKVTNLLLDFRSKIFQNEKFQDGFLSAGQIGGKCEINKALVEKPVKLGRELQSWYADLKSFTSFSTNHLNDGSCDDIIDKPVIFMKLDSGVNLYHHFCDFLNLYASQHINGSFSTDVYIIQWDTSSHPYGDLFKDTWSAFTRYPLKYLHQYAGRKVCFRNAVFSLPPRMIFGLYYNTPLTKNCHGGGLLKAFSEHVLHRLGVYQDLSKNDDDDVRVTLIKRSTKYRQIINQEELIGAMKRVKGINVTAVDYNFREMPFVKQLQISHNSDILIGVHGAGLTHMLFQPDWGAVFELYNTEDPDCYKDLANLRGLKHYTWEREETLFQEMGQHPSLGPHAKFANYGFDVDEFMRILTKAIKHVLSRRKKG